MSTGLEKIDSIINGFDFAKDKDKVFTYIEFVKMFGFEHNSETFITSYKDYVTQWAAIKKEEITLSDEDFVLTKMIEILKSITLDYSSYEEQDFIANIDLSNKDHLKALIAIYSRKIRQITEFYRKKRNESVLIVNKNSFKGAAKSIQEVIYEKVFDYLFSDRNIVPSYVNIKRDLLISIENYVDVYSEYFDIPRNRQFSDKTRAEMLSANINDIDYRAYLEIELVISEILFSGNVYLEEIPLIAQLSIDLSQNCVGDLLALKDNLMANTTVNQVPLTEQVALKRRLYEKFLGCDLYYMYVDLQGNVQMDVLCRADNPTGNLLNCGSADTATIENEQLELLSHIGLFFKPDKTSILKVNAKSFKWSVDTDIIKPDTMYVFPDPTKYGDIGNNKSPQYPLIMEYKLDYDIKNMSSGEACDDPLMFISDQGWRSYYSKQDDDFKLIDNTNYEYSFTYLANQGFIHNYQTDAWGNQFGILKGCNIVYKYDENDEIVGVKSITLPKNYSSSNFTYNQSEAKYTGAVVLNGGYFEDPFYQGEKTWNAEKNEFEWTFQGDVTQTKPFNFKKPMLIDDYYSWSGIGITLDSLYYSNYTNNAINCGEFGSHSKVQYIDNFQNVGKQYEYIQEDESIVKDVLLPFVSKTCYDDPEYELIIDETSWIDYRGKGGELYIKLCNSLYDKPKKFTDVFPWVNLDGEEIINFQVIHETLIIETNSKIKFIPYSYNGEAIISKLGMKEMLELNKSNFLANKIVYLESEKKFYIVQLDYYTFDNNKELSMFSSIDSSISTKAFRRFIIPRFYQFDPIKYTIKDIVHFSDAYYLTEYENSKLNKCKLWKDYLIKKEQIVDNDFIGDVKISNKKVKLNLLSQNDSEYSNLRDFEIFYKQGELEIKNFDFTFNSNLGIFTFCFSIQDNNNTPYVYDYKFKLNDVKTFNDSLKCNVYTLKNDGVGFRWNDKLIPNVFASYPSNTKTLGENSIFEYNELNEFGNDDSYFNGNSYKAKFDLVENDYLQLDEKYHVGHENMFKWVTTVDDTFGKDVKCEFSSDYYISDCETTLDRQEYIRTVCDLILTIDDYIKQGDNECKIIIRKLEAEGLMNKDYDFVDNKKQFFEQPFIGQDYPKDEKWLEVEFTNDESEGEEIERKWETSMTVHADSFGNVYGYHTFPIEKEIVEQVIENKKRKITGELRLCVHGTADKIKVEAHLNLFDKTQPITPIVEEPPAPVVYDYNYSGTSYLQLDKIDSDDSFGGTEIKANVEITGYRNKGEKGTLIVNIIPIDYATRQKVFPTNNNYYEHEITPLNESDDGTFESFQYGMAKLRIVYRGKIYVQYIKYTITSEGEDVCFTVELNEDEGVNNSPLPSKLKLNLHQQKPEPPVVYDYIYSGTSYLQINKIRKKNDIIVSDAILKANVEITGNRVKGKEGILTVKIIPELTEIQQEFFPSDQNDQMTHVIVPSDYENDDGVFDDVSYSTLKIRDVIIENNNEKIYENYIGYTVKSEGEYVVIEFNTPENSNLIISDGEESTTPSITKYNYKCKAKLFLQRRSDLFSSEYENPFLSANIILQGSRVTNDVGQITLNLNGIQKDVQIHDELLYVIHPALQVKYIDEDGNQYDINQDDDTDSQSEENTGDGVGELIEFLNGYYQTVDDGSFRKSSKTIIIIDENNVKIPITLTLSSKERKVLINAVSSTNYVRPILTDVINTYIPNDSSGPQFPDPYPETPVSIIPINVNT